MSCGSVKEFLIFALIAVLSTHECLTIDSEKMGDVEKKLSSDADLTEFYGMVERNGIAISTLRAAKCTIFAPTNLAFQGLDRKPKEGDYIPLYHMVNTAISLQDLSPSVVALSEGSPTLWISKIQKTGSDRYGQKNYTKYDMYVNNAKINLERSNFFASLLPDGKEQYLHVIEEVLQPLIKIKDSSPANPTALQFLEQYRDFDIGGHSLKNFWDRIVANGKQSLYNSADSRYTFFIPIDSPNQVTDSKNNKIDGKVIDGHIIQGNVLFTNPTPEDAVYKTLAFTDFIKVLVSFQSEHSNRTTENRIKRYVTSKTVVGDNMHPDGAVLANIVRANIPVKNGVIHLINRPLMVVDDTVIQFLKKDENGLLSEFLRVLRKYGSEVMNKLSEGNSAYTILAPINDAWKDSGVLMTLKNDTLMRDIVNLHIIPDRYSVAVIREKFDKTVDSLAPQKRLYFNVLPRSENNFSLTVEGGGTNATVLYSDIAATNGIIHIIDRVLGIPCSTIESKLATDPQLNLTYTLGKYSNFNSRLGKTGNLTYFVPRDVAWENLKHTHPTLYNILFSSETSYHAIKILEKHLIVDGVFTMAQLKNLTNVTGSIPAYRDHLNIRVKENNKGYSIQWYNEMISVHRADVRCTNGIIHVIDKVLLTESDIKISVGGAPEVASSMVVLNLFAGVIFAFLVTVIYH